MLLRGEATAGGFAGGLTGGLVGGLLSSKSGRKLGKKALRVGGIAAVCGLAYAAWSRYRPRGAHGAAAGLRPVTDPPRLERFVPPAAEPEAREELGRVLLRAMVAAAQADGKLDGAEHSAIFDRLAELDLSDAEKAELFAQLEKPVDLHALVAAARTPEIAAEIYAASLLAIEVDTPAERGYLAMLAARLDLPGELVEALHREADRETDGGPASPQDASGAAA